ncbi:MAG: hypothetical protein HY267_01005 [Deltaproteobacteria bacterium]|nr:hypothetical protein [Deltaproteobacteria bacterium]
MITNRCVAEKLGDYLCHRLTLAELVEWAEQAMMEEEFDEGNVETLRDIVSRLGLADVRAFGLTWEDCEAFLSRLGYQVQVEVSAAN